MSKLIVTRNRGQRIVIDREIYVEVLSVKGNQVRIAIEADPSVEIHREEILNRILKEEEDEN